MFVETVGYTVLTYMYKPLKAERKTSSFPCQNDKALQECRQRSRLQQSGKNIYKTGS